MKESNNLLYKIIDNSLLVMPACRVHVLDGICRAILCHTYSFFAGSPRPKDPMAMMITIKLIHYNSTN